MKCALEEGSQCTVRGETINQIPEPEVLDAEDGRDKSAITIMAHTFIKLIDRQSPLKRDARANKQAVIACVEAGDKILTYNTGEMKKALHVS